MLGQGRLPADLWSHAIQWRPHPMMFASSVMSLPCQTKKITSYQGRDGDEGKSKIIFLDGATSRQWLNKA